MRIGVLNVSTERMISMGSGVIVDAGPGAPTNQVLTAAHNFIDTNPKLSSGAPNPWHLLPVWTKTGLPTDITWSSDAPPLIIAVGLFEGDRKPSKWAYWAELVTPLATLQELRESPTSRQPPGSPPTQMLDLAVIRILGRLELDPPVFSNFYTHYSLKKKHAASLVLDPPLPAGRPLGDLNADPLELGDMINSFGWSSPNGEVTLHADVAKPVQALDRGLIMSESTMGAGDGGGPTVDRLGRIVGINSFGMGGTSYTRLVSELLPAHGLELAP